MKSYQAINIKLTYVVPSAGNQVIGGSQHRLYIARFRILDVLGYLLSEVVPCLCDRDREKGWREEARGMKVQCHHLTIWKLLEIAKMYIARA